MIIVSDTSVISNLVKIEKENLLKQLFGTIVIPKKVHEELIQTIKIKERVEKLDWIVVMAIKDVDFYKRLRIRLDPGESEAIVLAKELNASLLMIDERKGRKIARETGLTIVGLLGILIEAKKQGMIDKVKPSMDKLIYDIGFRVKPGLYQKILSTVEES